MTKTGYEYIVQCIKGRIVEPPIGYSCKDLGYWLSGYAKCQQDIIDILKNMTEDGMGKKEI